MNIAKIHTILYVAHQESATKFYEKVFDCSADLHVPGMTEFHLAENFVLGLMPEQSIQKILGDKTPVAADGNGIPRCELYLMTDHPEKGLERAIEAGAQWVSPLQKRDWGDTAGYVADPDGHIIAFAKQTKI